MAKRTVGAGQTKGRATEAGRLRPLSAGRRVRTVLPCWATEPEPPVASRM